MESGTSLVAIGALVLAGLGYLVVRVIGHVIGEIVADEAIEAVFRRPSWALRRRRHRGLMKSGFLCAIFSGWSAFVWLAVVTNGREGNAEAARMFAMLAVVFAIAALGLLMAWWRRAGLPEQ